MKKMTFTESEILGSEEVDAIGSFARDGVDAIVGGVIAYPAHWTAFTISEESAVSIKVTPGSLFKGSVVYSLENEEIINVQTYLPLITNDTRWIAVLVRGEVNTTLSNELIETDADTEDTVLLAVPKIVSRDATFLIQTGVAGPTPEKPAIGANECAIAYILLSTSGIETIVHAQGFRAKTLFEVEGRVTSLEIILTSALQSIETLRTDLANLAAKMKQIPRPELMRQLQRDTAAIRRRAALPDEARAYFYDPFLVKIAWDLLHGSWLGRVAEGGRYSFANERDAQLALISPNATTIKTVEELVLPAWTEVPRIAVEGEDGYIDISQLVHTVVDAIQRQISRSSVSYGPTVNACENQAEWAGIADARPGEIFTAAGETFQVLGLSQETNVYNLEDGRMVNAAAWNADPNSAGHQSFSVQQVQYNSWTETYWDYVTNVYGVNGSLYAQTFLCSQPMIATSVDLFFTRVGIQTGDVHLALCEVNMIGAPDLNRVIAETTVVQADLALGWVKFPFRPSLLQAGRRYAWFTVTTGNHAIATVTGNKFAQGSLFTCTDGIFFQGDTLKDFAFRLNAAKFASVRTVIDFEPLTLSDGMTELRLLYAGWQPEGTSLTWEIKPTSGEWTPFIPSTENPLYGLPALVQLRATMLGTTDLAPCIVMDSKARAYTGRPRNSAVWVSKVQTFGFTTAEIVVETTMDHYDPGHHSLVNKIIVDASTVITADATTVEIDFAKPTRRKFTSTFTLSPVKGAARVMVESTSDSLTNIPFIQNLAMYAI